MCVSSAIWREMPCCRDIGTHHDTRYWLNNEPCGFICGMMTWLLLGYGMYCTTYKVIQPWLGFGVHGSIHLFLFNSFCLLAMYSHFLTMTTNPGAVPKDACPLVSDLQEMVDVESNRSQQKYKKYCKRCKAFKPARAHHCSICDRCILKMDHHCPWVNNCIGLGNHKLFIVFLFWVFVVSAYALFLIIAMYSTCSMSRRSKHYCGGPSDALFVLMLLVEAILFGLFTLCMMADQLDSVTSNQTQIDRLKNQKHIIQSDINEVFGTPSQLKFSIFWMLPVPVSYPPEYIETIHGYRLIYTNGDRESELTPLTLKEEEESISDHHIQDLDESRNHDRDPESGHINLSRNGSSSISNSSTTVPLSNGKAGSVNVRKRAVN